MILNKKLLGWAVSALLGSTALAVPTAVSAGGYLEVGTTPTASSVAVPAPRPTPNPDPGPDPKPNPNPDPGPDPDPNPDPKPDPDPDPKPDPDPDPDPKPDPDPDPKPDPDPDPKPDPDPTPTGQNPGNGKPVGNSRFDGITGNSGQNDPNRGSPRATPMDGQRDDRGPQPGGGDGPSNGGGKSADAPGRNK